MKCSLDDNKMKRENKYKDYILKTKKDKKIKLSLETQKDLIENFGMDYLYVIVVLSNQTMMELMNIFVYILIVSN